MTAPDVRVFVQTRGTARATDYAFLGGAPPEPWWRAYRDATAFDHPTVLVTSDGAGWAAYLSGIPSSRVDAVGTVVRYTLVLDGPCGAADAACVPAAVGAWLDDVAAGHGDRPGGRLATALDARFPADDVERGSPRHDGRRHSVRSLPAARGAAARAGRARGPARPRQRRTNRATGSARPAPPHRGPRSRRASPHSSTVRRGGPCSLNLLGEAADAQPLLDPASPVAVLLETTDPRLARCTALPPVVEAKKAPSAARPTRRTGTAAVAGMAVLPVAAVIGMLAMTALVVTLLVWLPVDLADPPASAFDTSITAVGTRSRARLVFSVGGMWRGAGDDRSTAELSGVVTEAGTDRRLPVEGTLSVRLGRVVHTELHLRFGEGRITAAREVDLAPTSLPRLLGQTQQFLGQMLHQVATPGRVTLPGTLDGGDLEAEDVDVSIDLIRLLRVAFRAVR